MKKNDDIKKIVSDLDKQFDDWETNQKNGAAQKIDTKKVCPSCPDYCPHCGKKLEHDESKETKIQPAGKIEFDKEMNELEEQSKFVTALEETIAARNSVLLVQEVEKDLSTKSHDEIIGKTTKPRKLGRVRLPKAYINKKKESKKLHAQIVKEREKKRRATAPNPFDPFGSIKIPEHRFYIHPKTDKPAWSTPKPDVTEVKPTWRVPLIGDDLRVTNEIWNSTVNEQPKIGWKKGKNEDNLAGRIY